MMPRLVRLLLAACAFGLTAQAAPPSSPAPKSEIPTAADFGALPVITGPVISPDGRHVAAQGRMTGGTRVLIVDITDEKRSYKPYALPFGRQLDSMRWAGNDHVLLEVSLAFQLFNIDFRITRIVSIDVHTGKYLFLQPEQAGLDADIVHVDPKGRFVLLAAQGKRSAYPAVYRVDIATGAATEVVKAQRNVWGWFADPAGVVRAGLGMRGGSWWLLYREADGQPFAQVMRRKTSGERATQIERFVPALGSNQGYAIANGASGRFALYRYDFKTDSLGELVYEHSQVDVEDFDLGRDGTLASVSYTDDRAEVAWFDPELKKLQRTIDRALPGAINRVTSMTDDRNRMIVWSGAANDPGIYYVYDRAAKRIEALIRPYEALEGKRLSPMEPVRYRARDGLEIRGYLTLPTGRDAKGLPLVVMPHGGPFARDQWGYDPWVQYLASKGYAVLQPNFRGSTGFGRTFVDRGRGAWGRGMQDDIDDGVKWLADRGTADRKRVCIMGASFGGYAAMWAAVRNPDLYRCAISFAGISDVGAMLKYDRKLFAATRYYRDWRERVQGEEGFELDSISPIKSVDRLTVPILIAHGTDDYNVPLDQSKRLHEALLKRGRDHEYVTYQGEGHSFAKPENSIDFLNRVGAFLDKHNPS